MSILEFQVDTNLAKQEWDIQLVMYLESEREPEWQKMRGSENGTLTGVAALSKKGRWFIDQYFGLSISADQVAFVELEHLDNYAFGTEIIKLGVPLGLRILQTTKTGAIICAFVKAGPD